MRRHFSSSLRQSMPITDYTYYIFLSFSTQFCGRSVRTKEEEEERICEFYGCVWHIARCFCCFFSSRSLARSFVSRVFGSILPISIRCCFDENICIFYCFFMEYNLRKRMEIIEFEFQIFDLFSSAHLCVVSTNIESHACCALLTSPTMAAISIFIYPVLS